MPIPEHSMAVCMYVHIKFLVMKVLSLRGSTDLHCHGSGPRPVLSPTGKMKANFQTDRVDRIMTNFLMGRAEPIKKCNGSAQMIKKKIKQVDRPNITILNESN